MGNKIVLVNVNISRPWVRAIQLNQLSKIDLNVIQAIHDIRSSISWITNRVMTSLDCYELDLDEYSINGGFRKSQTTLKISKQYLRFCTIYIYIHRCISIN